MKALVVDFIKSEIVDEIEVESKEVIDDTYYKTEKGMIPIAYLINPDDRAQVQLLLDQVKEARVKFEKFSYNCFLQIQRLRI